MTVLRAIAHSKDNLKNFLLMYEYDSFTFNMTAIRLNKQMELFFEI